MTEEITPCPRCIGNHYKIAENHDARHWRSKYYMECPDCTHRIIGESQDKVIELWNFSYREDLYDVKGEDTKHGQRQNMVHSGS